MTIIRIWNDASGSSRRRHEGGEPVFNLSGSQQGSLLGDFTYIVVPWMAVEKDAQKQNVVRQVILQYQAGVVRSASRSD
jgi:hypothetical protein